MNASLHRGGLRLPTLPAPPAALRRFVERLPIEPPSLVLALVLNRVLLPKLDAGAREALAGQTVEVCVTDFGVRCRLALDGRGDSRAPREGKVRLRVAAPAHASWRMPAGDEDADALFFQRVLVMGGRARRARLRRRGRVRQAGAPALRRAPPGRRRSGCERRSG